MLLWWIGVVDHLILHGEVARELWSSPFQLFGVAWIMPQRVRYLLMSWRGQLGYLNVLELWRLTPLCLMWCIWRERNARSFEDREMAMLELKKMMFQSLYTWIIVFIRFSVSNFSEFCYFSIL